MNVHQSTSTKTSSSSTTNNNNNNTYEATRAHEYTDRLPDKIHWDNESSFRDEPYRLLHHQNGIIGTVTIRLLEACDLKRSYWSALAIGPVKHLGLSKAHGDVSSYCTFRLGHHDPKQVSQSSSVQPSSTSTDSSTASVSSDQSQHRQPKFIPGSFNCSSDSYYSTYEMESKSSPVVEGNNNPVWDHCAIELPIRKGSAIHDGLGVHLHVRVDEEVSAVEHFLPGIIPYTATGRNDRLLGMGTLDLTELLLGETMNGSNIDGQSQPVPGIRDEWIPITLQQQQQQQDQQQKQLETNLLLNPNLYLNDPLTSFVPNRDDDNNNNTTTPSITGLVRVLVSYQPNGFEPEKNDIVALESFARRHLPSTSCQPIIPPLQPFTVLDKKGPYVLCEYELPIHNMYHSNPKQQLRKGRVRLHRNVLFVVERQNIVDVARNIALLPIDVALSTPLGRAIHHTIDPLIVAGTELFMPTILTLKLVYLASRTAGIAGLSGIQALTGTLWREGSSSLLHKKQHNQPAHVPYSHQNSSGSNSSNNNNQQQRMRAMDPRSGTAQFVQL